MKELSIWQHIEDLRWTIVRSVIVVLVFTIVAFIFKDFVFNSIILAPCSNDFVSYKIINKILHAFSPQINIMAENISLININLAAQLFIHLSISFYLGLIAAVPYIIIEIWLYVSPALYSNERKPAVTGIIFFVLLFFLGIFIAFYIIFPITLSFLSSYQVSESVPNQISLNSYISTFLSLIFMIGLVFEMPVVAYFFAKIGVLKSAFLKKYRKVAIVIILILAAIITPTTDIFTMLLVAVPLQLLFECSVLVVKKVEKGKERKEKEESAKT
ncbi:MAG: twin-arginine translocase subunit TatC [Bacteroidales bacterium]|jgi:sec-independent protein translocase protein TatC|nr:twin-arginine translocase subunit TatC [Bacteroidales bacterium]